MYDIDKVNREIELFVFDILIAIKKIKKVSNKFDDVQNFLSFPSSSLGTHTQEKMKQKLIQGEAMMMEKISYIHDNPVKRGYVDEAKHWRYSSARDYEDMSGLIEIEKMW